jgi:hypothetical protein
MRGRAGSRPAILGQLTLRLWAHGRARKRRATPSAALLTEHGDPAPRAVTAPLSDLLVVRRAALGPAVTYDPTEHLSELTIWRFQSSGMRGNV